MSIEDQSHRLVSHVSSRQLAIDHQGIALGVVHGMGGFDSGWNNGGVTYRVPYRDPSFQVIAFVAFTGGVIPNDFTEIAIATANLLILIPYYIATVRVERKVVESRHPEIDRNAVSFAVRWMNRITYTLLAMVVLWWLATAIRAYPSRVERRAQWERGTTNQTDIDLPALGLNLNLYCPSVFTHARNSESR